MSAGRILKAAQDEARALREKAKAEMEPTLTLAVRQVIDDRVPIAHAAQGWGLPYQTLANRVRAARQLLAAQRDNGSGK